jgi:hypothetical protein
MTQRNAAVTSSQGLAYWAKVDWERVCQWVLAVFLGLGWMNLLRSFVLQTAIWHVLGEYLPQWSPLTALFLFTDRLNCFSYALFSLVRRVIVNVCVCVSVLSRLSVHCAMHRQR